MGLNFKDNNLALSYLQIKLNEQYNPNILILGNYYTYINNNYGFAHYIARYLNLMYPPLMLNSTGDGLDIDNAYKETLDDTVFNTQTKSSDDLISIANYFLCDNNGNRLTEDVLVPNTIDNINNTNDIDINNLTTYQKIYSIDIIGIFNILDSPLFISFEDLNSMTTDDDNEPINILVNRIKTYKLQNKINKTAKKDRIYCLEPWNTSKEICEIDNLVLSYLLGRTITPNSSMEEIYYAQQLLYGDNIPEYCKGLWVSDYGCLTDRIKEYQAAYVDPVTTNPLFVTGYFDIYTEAALLRDKGEQIYGILGL